MQKGGFQIQIQIKTALQSSPFEDWTKSIRDQNNLYKINVENYFVWTFKHETAKN